MLEVDWAPGEVFIRCKSCGVGKPKAEFRGSYRRDTCLECRGRKG